MKLSAILTLLLCASSLAACQTNAISEGAGYELLTPSSATASHITRTDIEFARQVASHNRQCRQDDACRK